VPVGSGAASLAPNAEITVYSWKEPEDLKQRTIDRVRRFLKAHVPMRCEFATRALLLPDADAARE